MSLCSFKLLEKSIIKVNIGLRTLQNLYELTLVVMLKQIRVDWIMAFWISCRSTRNTIIRLLTSWISSVAAHTWNLNPVIQACCHCWSRKSETGEEGGASSECGNSLLIQHNIFLSSSPSRQAREEKLTFTT
ncbi:hypothetical protein GVAMD_0106 [Gardnerella vaginalis AMD]|nr:hypothetical protein GVAMD_0106 [Gardnerella vaginalis AMD]